jgi:hypothetical protein
MAAAISGSRGTMFDWIQITAEYSNAVLVAILPHVSQFVKRAELPMPTPVVLQQVAEFKCYPRADDIGGLVILTNGLRIWFNNGYVNGFRTPRSYYNLQDPKEIARFYGTVKLNREEAIEFARESVRKLGYTNKETFTDQEPEVELPPEVGANIVPHYRFKWKDPVFGRTAVSVEVDAGQKQIQEMQLLSQFFWRSPPEVSVWPRMGSPKPVVGTASSNDFVEAVLPKISAFAQKLELPFAFPASVSHVERVEFVSFDSDVRIKLTNGYWFVSKGGVLTEFSAPDSVYGRQPPSLDPLLRPVEEYLGRWRVSEKEAIELVHRSIRKLGYTPKEFHANRPPQVSKPEQVGRYVVPRYSFRWLTNEATTSASIALVRAEVNADKGQLSYLELGGGPLSIRARVPPNAKAASNASSPRPMVFDSNAVQKLPRMPAPTGKDLLQPKPGEKPVDYE